MKRLMFLRASFNQPTSRDESAVPRGALVPAPRPYYRATRSIAEWFIALVAIVVLAPAMFAIGIVIKLHSPGPAFYSQIRLGRHGKPFRIYKFRTMTHNCEAATGAVWARSNDVRITTIGRVLRDTHLDELPQLWNVLRGEMSLIGPRPERPELAARIEEFLPTFSSRLVVKPGLTGLAQMRLPPDREIKEVVYKLAQDLHYIRHVGLLLDLRIVAATALVMIEAGCGAIARLSLGKDCAVHPGHREGLQFTINKPDASDAAESLVIQAADTQEEPVLAAA